MIQPEPTAHPDGRIHVLYPNTYVWLVFLASLDIMLTWIVLSPVFGGVEVNWLANLVIRAGGLKATVLYKFGLIVLVIVICEFIGRRRRRTGLRLATWCLAIQCIPVIAAFAQLLLDVAVSYGRNHDSIPTTAE
jgi:hypothetical protein